MISVAFETATSSQEIIMDGLFELRFELNCNLTPVFFLQGRLAMGYSVLAAGHHSSLLVLELYINC